MQISRHKVALIDYVLSDAQGAPIDSSSEDDPLAYIHGTDSLISGLEEELEGCSAGDSINVVVPPDKGYGQRDESLVQTVSRDQFEAGVELEVGMQFHAHDDDDGPDIVTITAIEGDQITLDTNHPLAGLSLHFDVTVVEVRDATAEELEHGHVHGPGGHHH